MKDQQQQDEQDLQIVDLDATPVSNGHATILPIRLLRLLPRQRRTQAVVTVSLVILVLLGIIGSSVSIRTKLLQAFVPPAPASPAAIVPGTDSFYVNGDVGWGRLFVDGRPVIYPSHSYDNSGNVEAPLRLTRGTHTLLWRADPFPQKMCTISVPNNYHTDTCKYDKFEGRGWDFSFPADITALSPASRTALIAVAQAALQAYVSDDIVQPGELYATDLVSKRQATAQEALKVTLHYELDTNLSSHVVCAPFNFTGGQGCIVGTQDCRTFCNAPNDFVVNATSTQTWNVFAAARSVWEYATLAGKPIVRHQVDVLNATAAIDQFVPLQIAWDGTQWHIKSGFSLIPSSTERSFISPICNSANNSIPVSTDEAQAAASWNFVAAPNIAAGCLGIVTLNQSQGAQSASSPALCLFRFGVFLAANEVAHKYWPKMPLADAYEQQLAQQIHNTSM